VRIKGADTFPDMVSRKIPSIVASILELMFFFDKSWKGKRICNMSNMESGSDQWQDREAGELNEYYRKYRRWIDVFGATRRC